MGMPVRIDNLLYEQAKNEAKAEHRTIAGHNELGCCMNSSLQAFKAFKAFSGIVRVSGEKIVRALEKLSFVVARQSGSHIVMKRGEQGCVVPSAMSRYPALVCVRPTFAQVIST